MDIPLLFHGGAVHPHVPHDTTAQARPEPRLETVMCPEDVQRRLSSEVDAEALLRCVAALRADPQWTMYKPFVWPPVWIWQVVYHPTGHIYTFRAKRIDAALWRFLEE